MPLIRTGWVLCVCGLLFSPRLLAEKAVTGSAVIEATLSEEGDRLNGEINLFVTNDTDAPLREIPVWLYPNRFLEINPNLNEGMLRWFYPKGVSRGSMAISQPRWNGHRLEEESIRYEATVVGKMTSRRAIARIPLAEPLLPGQTGKLELAFAVEIPERRGRFGRHRDTVSLAGDWFPRPLADLTGEDTSLPPDTIRADVRLHLPAERGAVVGNRVFLKQGIPQLIEVLGMESESIPVVVMKQMEVATRTYDWGKAIHVQESLPWREPTWKETLDDEKGDFGRFPEPGRFNRSERLFDIVGHTADLIRELAPSVGLNRRVVLVDIPAWDRLVQTGPGPVLVSDRLWRLLPLEGAIYFHDLAVVRAVSAELVWEAAIRKQSPLDRFVAADAVGTFMTRCYSEEIHQKQRTVEDIVGFASVFPTIDSLLYAPQIPFREVYFPSVEEPDPFRDEPWYFMNELPRGKRILGKLQDLVGREGAQKAVVAILEGEPLRKVVNERLGDAKWFFDQWYGAYPRVNYRLGAILDLPAGDGRVLHRIEVVREGAVIREPVTVRLEDELGVVKDLVWDNAKHVETLEWTSNAPLEHVEIDPEHRTVEAPELTGGHPFADNTNRLPWRPPMFTRLIIWGDLTTGEPYLDLGFWFRRRYDVSNVLSLDLAYTPRAYGGALSFYRFFGKKRTLNARSWVAGPTLSATRYREVPDLTLDVPDESKSAATMGAVGLALARDTRVYGWDPLSGTAFGLGASYGLGRSDDERTLHVGRVALQAGTLFSPGIRNTVAVYGSAFFVIGDPVAANLASLSGRQALRGFESDETYGRLGFFAVLEYRHTIIDAAHVTAPLYSWFDRFQGVLFAGGGTISEPGGISGIFSADRI
jgi:hypothetical protein